jgi:aspartyl-tRNA(Asn)/glutamyl-tRNA(Gln) amidotransferase subunit A
VNTVEIASAVRRGERSARDVVAEALERAENDRFNIWTAIDHEGAIRSAEEVDRRVGRREDPGPLAGVPVALKDLIDRAGQITTCGSAFYRFEAVRSAEVVERLERAGAVVIGRVGLHEFAYGFTSENPWFGPVRNPHDPELSAGGSSGGSAAAVAAGQLPLAVGTDTGGSIRVPAALCGVLGLKPTHGRVSLRGVFPLAPSLDTVGPLAASVADLAAGYLAMAGWDPADPWSRSRPVVTPGRAREDLRGLRIGVPSDWVDGAATTEEVAEAFSRAAAAISSLGAEVDTLDLGLAVRPNRVAELVGGEAARVHRRWLAEGRPYGEDVRRRLERAVGLDLDTYLEAREWQETVRRRFERAFETVDLLMTPTTGTTRKPIGREMVATLQGEMHHREVLSQFTSLVNVAGCPALASPLPGKTPPPSLQLIAPWWAEHRLLEVAATLAEARVIADWTPRGGV